MQATNGQGDDISPAATMPPKKTASPRAKAHQGPLGNVLTSDICASKPTHGQSGAVPSAYECKEERPSHAHSSPFRLPSFGVLVELGDQCPPLSSLIFHRTYPHNRHRTN